MDALAQELDEARRKWLQRKWPQPTAMIVTGSGLDVDLGSCSHGPIPLQELLPFAVSAIEGHALQASIVWPCEDRPVLYLRGRLHCYQGFDAHQVVFAVRLGALLGARVLLLTNAAGSLRQEYGPGTLALITDHLNLSGRSPLVGALPESWGARFPALNDAYDHGLRATAQAVAAQHGISLAQGVYAWLLGPSFETPAEILMLRQMGADLVGMSTVPEVLAARQLGVRCLACSLITNLAAGMSEGAPSHQEVLESGRGSSAKIAALLAGILSAPDLLATVDTEEGALHE